LRGFTAADYLKRAGYETYVPRLKIRKNGDDKIEPLFPSYIFAQTDLNNWSQIRWTIAVTRILMSGDRPAELPEHVMEEIRKREGPNGLIKLPSQGWIKGQTKLMVIRGTFKGFEAVFQCESPRQRVQILLAMFDRKVAVELPLRDVEAPGRVLINRRQFGNR
jgi:transcriptional antiterminator RfaH